MAEGRGSEEPPMPTPTPKKTHKLGRPPRIIGTQFHTDTLRAYEISIRNACRNSQAINNNVTTLKINAIHTSPAVRLRAILKFEHVTCFAIVQTMTNADDTALNNELGRSCTQNEHTNVC